MPRLLALSHDAQRTGAPIILCELLEWLSVRRGYEPEILLGDGGPLVPRFETLGTVHRVRAPTALSRITGGDVALDVLRRIQTVGRRHTDVVYSNTVVNGDVLAALRPSAPVMTHVHELGFWINHRVPPRTLARTLALTETFIAASSAVADALLSVGVSRESIEVIFEPAPRVTSVEPVPRAHLGARPDEIIVAGAGTLDWRKGTDLFLQLAVTLRRRPDVRFVWVGGASGSVEMHQLRHDLASAGLSETLMITGEVEDALPYLASCDVLALTSREDPFPRVALEAATLGKPVVYFRGAGGIGEVLEGQGGIAVDYLDISGFANAVERLLDDERMRHDMGMAGAGIVAARCDPDGIAEEVASVLDETLRRGGARSPA